MTRPSFEDSARQNTWLGESAYEIAKERISLWYGGNPPVSRYGPIPKDLSTNFTLAMMNEGQVHLNTMHDGCWNTWFGWSSDKPVKYLVASNEHLKLWHSLNAPVSWHEPISNGSTILLTDYVFYTMISLKDAHSEDRLVGIFGIFFHYKVSYNIKRIQLLLYLFYAAKKIRPSLAERITCPSLTRPWSLLVTSFYSPSFMNTMKNVNLISMFGSIVQKDNPAGTQAFLCLFFLPGVVIGASRYLEKQQPQPVGSDSAILALVVYSVSINRESLSAPRVFENNKASLALVVIFLTYIHREMLRRDSRNSKQERVTYFTEVLVGIYSYLLFQ